METRVKLHNGESGIQFNTPIGGNTVVLAQDSGLIISLSSGDQDWIFHPYYWINGSGLGLVKE